jgi:predicted TIM-barrel fold metal-dependent hydrolase
MFEANFYVRRTLWHFIYGGVFDRFPPLRFVMTEEGLDWAVPTMRRLERHVARLCDERLKFKGIFGPAASSLALRPMEYLQRNCYITASDVRPEEIGFRHLVGVNNVMWGADYPHDESTHPYTREALRALFGEVPVEECRRILGENAAELYGFDLDILRPVAERIGPSVEEVHTALDHYPDNSTLGVLLGELPQPGFASTLPPFANSADALG